MEFHRSLRNDPTTMTLVLLYFWGEKKAVAEIVSPCLCVSFLFSRRPQGNFCMESMAFIKVTGCCTSILLLATSRGNCCIVLCSLKELTICGICSPPARGVMPLAYKFKLKFQHNYLYLYLYLVIHVFICLFIFSSIYLCSRSGLFN